MQHDYERERERLLQRQQVSAEAQTDLEALTSRREQVKGALERATLEDKLAVIRWLGFEFRLIPNQQGENFPPASDELYAETERGDLVLGHPLAHPVVPELMPALLRDVLAVVVSDVIPL